MIFNMSVFIDFYRDMGILRLGSIEKMNPAWKNEHDIECYRSQNMKCIHANVRAMDYVHTTHIKHRFLIL